ncbi:hypothetical protein TanjilG_16344 [Lupinus angustifolius]|uniref:Uncharacterized protein n=1 Tax=Lupinus angustifolius TaxID=3871 RepID=A0A1J7I7C5_LUPAN|nr:PREDICTED: uncharacterized protein LOC109353117 [Lupinus angustifolius]OIW08763.1 hypothetical protein TanjilG_16344 [Lupinus angustifolius]
MTTTTLRWQPLIPFPPTNKKNSNLRHGQMLTVKAFNRREMDSFAQRMASGEAWKDAWRTANDGFERLLFEAKKTAERIDRRYSVSHRLSSVARSAAVRAREIDRDFEIGLRFRSFQIDFSRNWPMYRMQLNKFLNSPLGRSFATIFFIWFALSGWLFRVLIFATWVLPFAGPLLIGTLANTLVIKGTCPACQMQFAGYKNQIIRCTGCGNIVWQPKNDFFSRGAKSKSNSKSDPEIIDVDFEEK